MKRLSALASLLFAASVFAAPVPVAIFPPAADRTIPEGMPLAMADRAAALLASSGDFAVVHNRQLISMTRRHGMRLENLGDANEARAAAQRLGVKHYVYSTLKRIKDGYTLDVFAATVGDPATQSAAFVLPKGEAQALSDGALNLANSLTKLAGAKPVTPWTELDGIKDPAVRDYMVCNALVLKQPLGIENPTSLSEADLTRAIGLCGSAVKASPKLTEAWAALALANAVASNDDRALIALRTCDSLQRQSPRHLPNATLARFWLTTRYQSNEAGEQVLRAAIANEPGFLLGHTYLGELYNAEGKHAEASKVWQDYAALTPNNPFAINRLAYTLARLGKAQEAASYAEKATAFDPQSVELNLEYASRLIDAGQLDKAIAVLEPLAKPADARSEVVLRLGYAKLLKGDDAGAEPLLKRALAAAKEPADWRNRARAKMNLAVVAQKRGKNDEAKKLVGEAAKEGLVPRASPENSALLALFKPEELSALEGKAKAKKEATPFTVKNGEVDPAAPKPMAPKELADTLK